MKAEGKICESCNEKPATTHSKNPDWCGYELCGECADEYDNRAPLGQAEGVTAAGVTRYLDAVPDELLAKKVERKIEAEGEQAWQQEQRRREEEQQRKEAADKAHDIYLASLPDPEEETP
ncbi:MAG: hypothetical protein KKD44_27420 [Proteobacteria bacterium]|nr:hypothetical protein [Pseudomonadota bacterium]